MKFGANYCLKYFCGLKATMDYKKCFLMLVAVLMAVEFHVVAQHEDIPYQNVNDICETCSCRTRPNLNKKAYFHSLDCAKRNFEHILARWPEDFGTNHDGMDIVATFSMNKIKILQQLPATNASLTFACQHCHITDLQAPTFMDVPNIKRLDLSYNLITTDELTADVFRGPYRANRYEPIALQELDLSFNKLRSLDKRLFEHTPNMKRLYLNGNDMKMLDSQIIIALRSITTLELLDLSNTGIGAIPATMFATLTNLQVLLLAGNKFTTIPVDFAVLGKTLTTLNLASNPIKALNMKSFSDLVNLRHLNISGLYDEYQNRTRHSVQEGKLFSLHSMAEGTLMPLKNLEKFYCSNNPKLERLDMNSLLFAKNLSEVDVSYCGLTNLTFPIDFTTVNVSVAPKPWPKLRRFEITGNPLLCDCELFQTMDYIGIQKLHKDSMARCENPYIFAGALIANYSSDYVCSLKLPKKYRAIDEEPPRFMRKRYLILTLIIASIVIVVGLIAGFIVACIRRRLKRSDYGIEPIRYMSVRSSNLSAFTNSMQRNNNRISENKA